MPVERPSNPQCDGDRVSGVLAKAYRCVGGVRWIAEGGEQRSYSRQPVESDMDAANDVVERYSTQIGVPQRAAARRTPTIAPCPKYALAKTESARTIHNCASYTNNHPRCLALRLMCSLTDVVPSLVPHNAAVQRPRDQVSSAPRVHNEMTHMRRARIAV